MILDNFLFFFIKLIVGFFIDIIISKAYYIDDLQFFLSGFNTPGNDSMYSLIILYSEVIGICLFIFIIVSCLLIFILDAFAFNKEEEYGDEPRTDIPYIFNKKIESLLDIFFLVIPTLIVIYILIPTIGFLYSNSLNTEKVATSFSIDIIGNQWYWSYGYNLDLFNNFYLDFINESFVFKKIQYESILDTEFNKKQFYMTSLENSSNKLRLLSLDKSLIIPINVYIDCYITSEDVIHSWAVPQLGIKVDAIPGRIANFLLYGNSLGIFHGQCSELCGVLHGYMPICVEVVNKDTFFIFINCLNGWFKGFSIISN